MTGSSSLDPDNFPSPPDRSLGKGHGTGALGPSDSSDSGSDVQGGGAGRHLGDANLDSHTDAAGTGERGAVGNDKATPDGADIDVDHIETLPLAGTDDEAPEDMPSRDQQRI